jgi:hypothetical protein
VPTTDEQPRANEPGDHHDASRALALARGNLLHVGNHLRRVGELFDCALSIRRARVSWRLGRR